MKLELNNLRDLKLTSLTSSAISKRYKSIVITVIAIAISVILLLIVAKPRVQTILKLRKEVGEEQLKLDSIKTKAEELASLDKDNLEAQIKLVNRALPFEKDVSGAVIGMERLAADAGLTVDTLALTPGEVSTGSATVSSQNEIEIKASLNGPFLAIKEFSKNVRRSLRVFGFREGVISVVSGNDSNKLAANFNVIIYFLPLPKTTGKIESPLPELNDDEKQIMNRITRYQFVSSVPQATSSSRVDPFAKF